MVYSKVSCAICGWLHDMAPREDWSAVAVLVSFESKALQAIFCLVSWIRHPSWVVGGGKGWYDDAYRDHHFGEVYMIRRTFSLLLPLVWCFTVASTLAFGQPEGAGRGKSISFGYPKVAVLTEGNNPVLNEIFERVFGSEGYRVGYREFAFNRALAELQSGGVDAVPLCIRAAVPGVLWPKNPVSFGFGQFAFLPTRFPKGAPRTSEPGVKLAVLTGSGLETFFPKFEWVEVRTREQALKMLLLGRVDVFVDGADGLQVALRALTPKERNLVAFVDVGESALFVRFRDDAEGKKLVQIWDSRFPALVESGEYLKIVGRYDPYPGFAKRLNASVLKHIRGVAQKGE
jgi:ABC-type amino acid transport substrate-binding protein